MTQNLTGKYFITGALIPGGMPGLLTRGKILGPVNDFAMHYLVEIYQMDSARLAPRSQVVYGLDALARPDVYLYDDKEIWELEFQRVYTAVVDMQKRMAAEQRREARSRAQALAKLGVQVVGSEEEAMQIIANDE